MIVVELMELAKGAFETKSCLEFGQENIYDVACLYVGQPHLEPVFFSLSFFFFSRHPELT